MYKVLSQWFAVLCPSECSASEIENTTNYANPIEWLMLHEFISNNVNSLRMRL